MIRKFQAADLEETAQIWLETNLAAHDFIPAQYWRDHFQSVKAMLLQAEIYIYERPDSPAIQGFIGLDGDYIAGIFVRRGAQSQGIGRQLLDFAKAAKPRLRLKVYEKNVRAIGFYQREGFRFCRKDMDRETQEPEYEMRWPAIAAAVDPARCIGCGMCAYAAPGVFRIEGAVSTVLPNPDPAQAGRAASAADGCPVNAIRIQK